MVESNENEMCEKLESIFDIIDRAACQLEGLIAVAKSINQNMFQAQLGLKAIAAGMMFSGDMTPEMKKELEDQIEEKAEAGQVHMVAHKNGIKLAFALCEAKGSPDCPNINTSDYIKVTCPECHKIILGLAAQEKS